MAPSPRTSPAVPAGPEIAAAPAAAHECLPVPGVTPDLWPVRAVLVPAASPAAPLARRLARELGAELVETEASAQAILSAAGQQPRSMIVVPATSAGGWHHPLHRDAVEEIVARTPVPVLLAPAAALAPRPARVVVALDGTPAAESVLGPAVALDRALGAGLDLVHVTDPLASGGADGAEAVPYLHEVAQRLCAAGVAHVRVRIALLNGSGDVAADLRLYARREGAAALAVATHARRGLDRLLHGSVAARVAAHATIPVLLVHAHPA